MTIPSEISERLDKLERSNRRLEGLLSIVFCCVGAVWVMGAAVPKVLEAEKFVLRDSGGAERGEIFGTETSRGIVFFNKNGERGLALVVNDQMNALILADQNGNLRESMSVEKDKSSLDIYRPGSNTAQFQVIDTAQGTAVTVRDRANVDRVSLGESEKGAAMTMMDKDGRTRVVMADGELAFASFLKDGGIAWSPGWDKFSPEEQKQLNEVIRKSSRP
jgi:hypothetical protein